MEKLRHCYFTNLWSDKYTNGSGVFTVTFTRFDWFSRQEHYGWMELQHGFKLTILNFELGVWW